MQNTSVVNIEIKSVPVGNSSPEASVKKTVDDKGGKPFDETLTDELQKADAEQPMLAAKKNRPQKLADTTEQTESKQANKAEKKVTNNGNELPGSKQVVETIVTEEKPVMNDVDEITVLPSDEKTAISTDETVELVTINAVPVDKSVQQTAQQVDSVNVNSESKKHVEKPSTRNTTSIVSSDVSESVAKTAQSKADVSKEPNQIAEKNISKAVDVAINPKNTSSESKLSSDNTAPVVASNSNAKNNAQPSDKELVIKQINIAKESNIKTDNPIKSEVVASEAPKMKRDETANTVKTPISSVLLGEKLVADSSPKQSKVTKQLNIDTDVLKLKPTMSGEAVTSSQRETMVLDKKLVELVELNTSRSSLVDAKPNVTQVPASSLSSQTVPTVATVTSAPVLDIQPALKTEAWERVMAGRVVWMAREGLQRADLKLNPAHLGPVEVRLTINNDQASVSFVAQNPATREALEQSLPRLREGFQSNGLSLANADVSDQAMSQGQDEYQQTGSGILFSQDIDDEEQIDDALIVKDDEPSGLSLYV